jgi:hypothetical protein
MCRYLDGLGSGVGVVRRPKVCVRTRTEAFWWASNEFEEIRPIGRSDNNLAVVGLDETIRMIDCGSHFVLRWRLWWIGQEHVVDMIVDVAQLGLLPLAQDSLRFRSARGRSSQRRRRRVFPG